MYNLIVRSRVRKLWLRVGNGDYMKAVSMASPKVYFHFMGTTAWAMERPVITTRCSG